jgi:hypothetical protein
VSYGFKHRPVSMGGLGHVSTCRHLFQKHTKNCSLERGIGVSAGMQRGPVQEVAASRWASLPGLSSTMGGDPDV